MIWAQIQISLSDDDRCCAQDDGGGGDDDDGRSAMAVAMTESSRC